MTVFYGARDLYEITGTVTRPQRRAWLTPARRRLLAEYALGAAIVLAAMLVGACMDAQ